MKYELKTIKFVCDECKKEIILQNCDYNTLPDNWSIKSTYEHERKKYNLSYDGTYIEATTVFSLLGDVSGNNNSDIIYCEKCSEKFEIRETFK